MILEYTFDQETRRYSTTFPVPLELDGGTATGAVIFECKHCGNWQAVLIRGHDGMPSIPQWEDPSPTQVQRWVDATYRSTLVMTGLDPETV